MRALLVLVTAAFSAFSLWAIARLGPIGFFEQLLASPAGWQTLADVCIALTLVLVWMSGDARRHGRAFWPWVPVTVLLGSIGPLLYLLTARRAPRPAAPLHQAV